MPTSNTKELIIKITSKEDDKGFDKAKQSLKDLKMQQAELIRSLIAQDEKYNREQKANSESAKQYSKDRTNAIRENERKLNEDLKKFDRDRLEATRKNAQLNRQEAQSQKTFTGQSTTLGSEQALKEQIKYWNQYKSTLAGTNPQIESTTKHINQLKTALNQVKGGGASRSDWEHWENLTTVFAGVGTALYGAYLAGQQFIGFITDAVKKSAELEIYSKKFEELAGSEQKAVQQLNLLYSASAGNLNDTQLVQYSNKMQLLGFTAEETAQVLDIVERKADEVGVTFEAGQSALQSFILTGRGRALKELGINVNEVTAEMDKLILASGKTKESMEAEEMEAIRLTAIINLYGDSLTNINQKQKDSGDRIKSLSTLYDKFVTESGKPFLELFNKTFTIVEKTSGAFVTLAGKMGIAQSSSTAFGNTMLSVGKKIAIGMIFPITNLINEISFLISEYEFAMNKFSTAREGLDTSGNTNIDRNMDTRFDKPLIKIAKRGIGEEQITEKFSGSRGTNTVKDDISEIKEIVQAVDEIELLKQQIFNKISRGGLDNKIIGNGGLPNAGLDATETFKLKQQFEVSMLDAELNKEKTDPMAEWDKLTQDSSALLGNISNVMSILGVGTNTFVGQMLSGFQDAISLIGSIGSIAKQIGQGDFIGAIFSGIGSIFGLGRSSGSGGRSPDFSRFNGGLAGGGNNMRIEFGDIKGVVRGEDIYISATAFKTGLNQRRF